MFGFKSAASVRPVWYTLASIRTVRPRPVVVFGWSMQCRAMATV